MNSDILITFLIKELCGEGFLLFVVFVFSKLKLFYCLHGLIFFQHLCKGAGDGETSSLPQNFDLKQAVNSSGDKDQSDPMTATPVFDELGVTKRPFTITCLVRKVCFCRGLITEKVFFFFFFFFFVCLFSGISRKLKEKKKNDWLSN